MSADEPDVPDLLQALMDSLPTCRDQTNQPSGCAKHTEHALRGGIGLVGRRFKSINDRDGIWERCSATDDAEQVSATTNPRQVDTSAGPTMPDQTNLRCKHCRRKIVPHPTYGPGTWGHPVPGGLLLANCEGNLTAAEPADDADNEPEAPR